MKALLGLMQLKEGLAELKLSELDEDTALKALSAIGFDGSDQVKGFLSAARAVSANPEESVLSFITDGGFARLFSSKLGVSTPSEPSVVQCVHCDGLNFIK